LWDRALPTMQSLVASSQLTAHIAVLDRGEAVYVEKVDTPGFIKMDTWIGRRMDAHSTSVGKAMLAHLGDSEADSIIRNRELNRRTPKTITDPSQLMIELRRVRSQGYAVDDEENSIGARCIAVALLDGYGRPRAALGLSGTTSQITRASVARLAATLRGA